MKDFFITKQLIEKDNCKLPDEIPVSYVDEYIGNSESEFLINIPEGSSNNNFTELFNVLQTVYKQSRNNPNALPRTTVSKDWLFDHYDIIEIPDYGFQSMSPYYTDFVPQVYYGKTAYRKIWQRNVTRIRSFTLKTVWLVLPKSKKYEDADIEFPIKIAFKPAKPYGDLDVILLSNFKYDDNSKILSLWSSRIDYSYNFKDLNDYDLYIDDNIYESKLFFFDISFSPVTNVINQQGNYFNQINNTSNLIRNDNSKVVITLKLKVHKGEVIKSTSNKESLIHKYTLKYRGNRQEYILSKDIPQEKKQQYFSNNFNLSSDYKIFNSDGQLGNYSIYDNIEIIPEYSSIRKYAFTNSLNSLPKLPLDFNTSDIPAILYSQYIYPWNLRNPQFEIYGSDGLLKYYNKNDGENKKLSISAADILIIYDTDELDDSLTSAPDISKFDSMLISLIREYKITEKRDYGNLYYYYGELSDNSNIYYPIRYDENVRTYDNEIKYYKSSSGYYHFSTKKINTSEIDNNDKTLTTEIQTIENHFNTRDSNIENYHKNDSKYIKLEEKFYNMTESIFANEYNGNPWATLNSSNNFTIENIPADIYYLLRLDISNYNKERLSVLFQYNGHNKIFEFPIYTKNNNKHVFIWCNKNTKKYLIPTNPDKDENRYSIQIIHGDNKNLSIDVYNDMMIGGEYAAM